MSIETDDVPEDVVANLDVSSALDSTSSLADEITAASTLLSDSNEAGISFNTTAAPADDDALTDTDALTEDGATNILVEAATNDSAIAFTVQENASTDSDPSSFAGVNGAFVVAGCAAAVVAVAAALYVFKKKRQATKEDPELQMVTPHSCSVV